MQYNFEWDTAKAKKNLRDHKVSFERASQVFADPFMLSIEDEEHSDEEERWITLGVDRSGILLVVHHTFREVDPHNYGIRLISARKPTRREAKHYHTR
ncbi:MAG: BrnT family toxin [Anaerolineae bacterium]